MRCILLKRREFWYARAESNGRPFAHQVPLANVKKDPEQLQVLEAWMRSMRPEELFDSRGKLIAELKDLTPKGHRRMGANPHANGGLLRKELRMPDFPAYAANVEKPG